MMATNLQTARQRLENLIEISRDSLYRPIQIAEVLYHSRTVGNVHPLQLETYLESSPNWRDDVTLRISGRMMTSTGNLQHVVWKHKSMPPEFLAVLDHANKRNKGAIERYIYLNYRERQREIQRIIAKIEKYNLKGFHIEAAFELFTSHVSTLHSVDKVYEIALISLLTVVATSIIKEKTYKIGKASSEIQQLFNTFPKLPSLLLDSKDKTRLAAQMAQVKFLTLDERLASESTVEVEGDSLIFVCKDSEARSIQNILTQIGWRRMCSVVKESELIDWYEYCLSGGFRNRYAKLLVEQFKRNIKEEFPSSPNLTGFLEERGYVDMKPPDSWRIKSDKSFSN